MEEITVTLTKDELEELSWLTAIRVIALKTDKKAELNKDHLEKVRSLYEKLKSFKNGEEATV